MRKTTFTLALVAVMALMLIVVGSASARTTGFSVYNLTSQPVKITNVETYGTPVGEPVFEEGSVKPHRGVTLGSGEMLHFELENPFSYTRHARIEFEGGGNRFTLEADNYFKSRCSATGSDQCSVQSNGKVTLMDPPGSKNVLNSGDIQGEARILKTLCSKEYNCEFEPTEKRETTAEKNVVGSSVVNCNKGKVETTIAAHESTTITNSVGVDVSAGVSFFEIFKASVTLHYKISIANSREFSQSVNVEVPEKQVAWVSLTYPVIRVEGNFTLKAGNTEWVLNGVYVDSPNPEPKLGGEFIVQKVPLTEQELKDKCHGRHAEEALVPTSLAIVNTEDQGTGAADLMIGGPESNTLRGFGGHDVIRGGGGNDTIFGGGGNDAIKGGPGADTLNGGPGADRIDDLSGPTTVNTGTDAGPARDWVDVADGEADDTVICESPLSTVYADPGDQVGSGCGRVIIEGSGGGS
jgi:Ca2+-binding RTX toxin-like protein